MNDTLSMYLRELKPVLKELMVKLERVFDYASILATDSIGKTYSVAKSGVAIGPSSYGERGVVIRVYHRHHYYEYALSHVTQSDLEDIVKTIQEKLCEAQEGIYNLPQDEPLILAEVKLEGDDPKQVGDEAILARLQEIKEQGIGTHKQVVDYRATYEYLNVSKLFLSPNRDLEQHYRWSNSMMMCIANKDQESKYYYKTYSGTKGVELLEELAPDIQTVVDTTIELLSSETIVPGEYEVVCDPDITGLIAHEAFGHGVEMDMFVKNRALAQEYIGKQVASEIVTMHDGASAAADTGSYFFDDEGIVAGDTVIIEKGILKQGISDALTAQLLGTVPTGNGRRQSYDHKVYTRMTNTFFEPGNNTLEEMIASISYGFLLEAGMSGMEDPKNWGIQAMVGVAREIREGRLTGKIYSPAVLTGYVPDLLKSISMISSDLELSGSGGCGKGYKEWVKVSAGGSYIKARVRLG